MTASTRRITLTVAVALAATAVIAYLAVFDPTVWPAPKCPFHTLTGLDCPGCGTQRAVHALFHGEPAKAWAYNPALFVALPLAVLYAWSPKRIYNIMYARATLYSIPVAIIVWWIIRNLI